MTNSLISFTPMMTMDSELLRTLIYAAIAVVGGYLAGRVFELIALARLRHIAQRTRWEGDDILIGSLRGVPALWFAVAGAFLAMRALSLQPTIYHPLSKALVVVLIASVTVVGARIAGGFSEHYARKALGTDKSVSILRNLAKLIVWIVGLLVALHTVGISITPLLTALGVGGLAVALALQDTLSNLFAGVHLIAAKKVTIGDYVKLDSGEEGYVADVAWRNTTIRALPNNLIIVPNAKLANAIVTNYQQPEPEMAVLIQVGVSYDSNLSHVEEVTKEVARDVMHSVKGGIPDFEPFIRYHTFGDFSINFTVILRCREYVDQYLIKHEFVKKLQERFRAEGIEIPFPIRTLHMRNTENIPVQPPRSVTWEGRHNVTPQADSVSGRPE
ncbi:MAG: mechanosensitive ion channel family protein [bacterium]